MAKPDGSWLINEDFIFIVKQNSWKYDFYSAFFQNRKDTSHVLDVKNWWTLGPQSLKLENLLKYRYYEIMELTRGWVDLETNPVNNKILKNMDLQKYNELRVHKHLDNEFWILFDPFLNTIDGEDILGSWSVSFEAI